MQSKEYLHSHSEKDLRNFPPFRHHPSGCPVDYSGSYYWENSVNKIQKTKHFEDVYFPFALYCFKHGIYSLISEDKADRISISDVYQVFQFILCTLTSNHAFPNENEKNRKLQITPHDSFSWSQNQYLFNFSPLVCRVPRLWRV